MQQSHKRIVHSLEKKIKVIKSYLEGVGIRSIARLENISAPMIINLIRAFSKKLQEKLQNQKVNEDIRNIEILEIDELFTYVQKKLPESTYGLLLIVNRNEVIDIEVTTSRDFGAYLQLALRLEKKYKIKMFVEQRDR